MSAKAIRGPRREGANQGRNDASGDTAGSGSARRPNLVSGVGARLGRAAQAGAQQVARNPFATVAGAAAVSAGLALLLPSSRREAEVMGEVADKLGDVAREAADGMVAAGRAQVESLAQSALAGVGGAVLEAVGAAGGGIDDRG